MTSVCRSRVGAQDFGQKRSIEIAGGSCSPRSCSILSTLLSLLDFLLRCPETYIQCLQNLVVILYVFPKSVADFDSLFTG